MAGSDTLAMLADPAGIPEQAPSLLSGFATDPFVHTMVGGGLAGPGFKVPWAKRRIWGSGTDFAARPPELVLGKSRMMHKTTVHTRASKIASRRAATAQFRQLGFKGFATRFGTVNAMRHIAGRGLALAGGIGIALMVGELAMAGVGTLAQAGQAARMEEEAGPILGMGGRLAYSQRHEAMMQMRDSMYGASRLFGSEAKMLHS